MTGSSAAVAEMKEIAALMKDSGLEVYATSGWENRGRSSSVNYWAVLCHHTAATDDITNMLINGRSDLPGPLCNWELQEYGRWGLIASGRANHAGEGTLPSSESYGIEATGPQGYPGTYGPAAFPGNYESYITGVACILAVIDSDTGDVFGHKETATPPGRKIDPYFDMAAYRKKVASETAGEDDLSAEAEAQIAEIHDGLQVAGTRSVPESIQLLFDRVKRTEDALQVTGTKSPQEGVEILYRRVQYVERGIDAICNHLGIPFDPFDTSTIGS